MKRQLFYASLIVMLFQFGCVKEDFTVKTVSYDKALMNKSLSVSALSGKPSYPLDWENITYMPAPNGVRPVPVPWQSGLGGAKIDQDILYDYAKSDGWELVYNTFNDSIIYNPSYFMLYNKFRGVLRTYFYFAPGQSYPSNNLVSALLLKGSSAVNSPSLKFSATDIVDFNGVQTAATQLQPYQVSSTGSWYASEFELAYDQNTINTPYPSEIMEWQINPNSISDISLNGNVKGSIDGTIAIPTAKTNFFGTLVNTLVKAGVNVGGAVLGQGASALGFLVNGTDHSAQKAALDAVGNGANGVISGFLNGIFGFTKKSTTTEKVKLTLNTNLVVDGTSTTSSQLFDNNFAIPGTPNNEEAIPFYPLYNKPMGIFYITAQPDIIINIKSQKDPMNPRLYTASAELSVNQSSFDILFNPEVKTVADIENIEKIVVVKDWEPTLLQESIVSYEQQEDIMGEIAYSGHQIRYDISNVPRPNIQVPPDTKVFLRLSFDVVPKNGAPKQTIVKTFSVTTTKKTL